MRVCPVVLPFVMDCITDAEAAMLDIIAAFGFYEARSPSQFLLYTISVSVLRGSPRCQRGRY